MRSHEEAVEDVMRQVRARPPDRKLTIRKKLAHGHTPHSKGYKSGGHPVDLSGLDRILDIDVAQGIATVEGEVTIGELCRATLPLGLMPAVVPELETFTMSGLIAGLGIETSSHRHGLFPESLIDFEMVLGNGEVVTASLSQHPELFRLAQGTFGTLGLITRARFQLVRARPFVRSRYRRFTTCGPYLEALGRATESHDFVEGFVFARDLYVLVESDYAEASPGLEVFHAMTHGEPWYHQHAEAMSRDESEDLVPAYEYAFRLQRSLFWVSGVIGNSPLFSDTRRGRAFLDRATEKKVRQQGLRSDLPAKLMERCLVSQDLGVRLDRVEEILDHVARHFGIFPIWNCPYRPKEGGAKLWGPTIPGLLVDVGIYGEPSVKGFRHVRDLRKLQSLVDAPSIWGVCYLSPEELRRFFDFEAYGRAREAYHAKDAFVDIESKVRFVDTTEDGKGILPLWRYLNLYYDLKARLGLGAVS